MKYTCKHNNNRHSYPIMLNERYVTLRYVRVIILYTCAAQIVNTVDNSEIGLNTCVVYNLGRLVLLLLKQVEIPISNSDHLIYLFIFHTTFFNCFYFQIKAHSKNNYNKIIYDL